MRFACLSGVSVVYACNSVMRMYVVTRECMPDSMNWEHVGYIKASDYRKAVLLALDGKPQVPSELEERTGIDIAHVSRATGELREKGLVTLLVPEETKKGRVYGLTDEGRELASYVS